MSHKCAHPTCERQVLNEKLACLPHWYQLPSALRERINIAWRARQNGSQGATLAHLSAAKEALMVWQG